MHLYTRLNRNLQEKIDIFINKNNKNKYKNKIKQDLDNFNYLKFKWLYFKHYNDCFNKYPKLFLGFDLVLNNILFWLNNPYSKQFDTPFMSGFITERCKKTIKKINPETNINIPFDDNGIYLNCDILKYFYNSNKINKIDTKHIIMNILNTLSSSELEDLYIFSLNKNNKNIIDITIKFT